MERFYSICWNITSKCNENCKFCYKKVCNDNSFNENKNIFDNLSNVNISKLSFCGGEPLLYDKLFELVSYIRRKNPDIKLTLVTNGQLIDSELIEKIIRHFDRISLPIDSSDNSVSHEIGRGKKSFNKSCGIIRKI